MGGALTPPIKNAVAQELPPRDTGAHEYFLSAGSYDCSLRQQVNVGHYLPRASFKMPEPRAEIPRYKTDQL